MEKRIGVYAECNKNGINPVFYELLTKAEELRKDLKEDYKLCGIIMGKNISNLVDEMKASGVDEVFFSEDDKLEVFNVDYYSAVLKQFIEDYQPEILLIGATALGEELAPTMGLQVNTGVAAHCTDLRINEEGELVQVVPAFGGKVLGEIFTPHTLPKIASVKPGIFTEERLEKKDAVAIEIDKTQLNAKQSRLKVLDVYYKAPQGIPMDKADVVVCGGFGMGSKENWNLLDELAVLLNGAVGCTRPAIDEGWVPDEENMIGTSGRSIRPKVYIGAGISGATHHLCGMKDSGVIISINKDESAEIFNTSDYKIVGDASKVLKAIIEEIKA